MHSENGRYLDYLPRIFKEGTGPELEFLDNYLKIFETLLTAHRADGPEEQIFTGLEEQIDRFINCLDAGLTPVKEISYSPGETVPESPFLNYLAGWVALVFDQNWPLSKKRQWLQKIVPLYKKRGTRAGLVEYLNMFVGKQAVVEELPGGFIIAGNSTVGVDSFIAGAPAYYFRVKINYGFPEDGEDFKINEWKNVRKGITAIVDLEKPAHTYYNLDARTPGFIVADRSTVAKDTLIWEKSTKIK